MKIRMQPYILLFILLLAGCGSASPASPQATADPGEFTEEVTVMAAIEMAEPTPVPTTVPSLNLPTKPAVTATSAPEPATATPPPTVLAEATETETAVPPIETVSSTTVSSEPITATPTATNGAGSQPPNPPPPPPAGGVPAPTDANYPGNDDRGGWENRITVPAGFKVNYVGRVIGGPTSITFGPDALLYIAVQEGFIYTMNSSGDVNTFTSGLNVPTGLAFRPGTSDLYVSDRVANENVGGEAQVSIVGRGQVVGGLPCCYTFYHAANGIAFGPDGMGYVGVGGRADHGEILNGPNAGQLDSMHPYEASILRFNPDTGEVAAYARGFRNPYDLAFDSTGQMWATDNTPDYDPPERLHRVVPGGQYGYPWYDCDVCFSPPDGVNVIPPLVTFPPSSSPTGITVYKAAQFPGYYDSIFVALWSAFPGAQKIMHIRAGGSAPVNFATGFAAPVDVVVGPDGNMYVADWATGIIFKISYTG